MVKRIFLLITALFIAFGTSIAAHAETDGEVYTEIDAYLRSELEKARIPGAAVMIVDKESVLFSGTYGNCGSIDTSFIIGSMSKSFTAVAIIQLVEQGKINLDDYVSKHLPDLSIGDRITVKQLLNHTSGLGTYQTRESLKITDALGIHVYANVNYGLLGEIIEAVSGMSFEKYIKENIYSPLGMTHSYTSLADGKNGSLIDGYRNYFGIFASQEVRYHDTKDYWSSVSAGYLISSASDMRKYLQMYLNNGDGIVSADSVNTIFYDNVYDEVSNTYYGMGWTLNKNYSEPILAHSGLVENYTSNMFILPESGIGVVMLVNMNDYFAANILMNTIGVSVLFRLMGEEITELGKADYMLYHLLQNGVYAAILLTAILPLVFIKRWSQKMRSKKASRVLIAGSVLHIVFPTFLLLIPALVGIPFFVIRGFVPDLFIVLIVSAAVSYVTGVIKAWLFYTNHMSRR